MHNWLDVCRHQVSTSLRARRDTLDTSGQATPLPILKAQIEGDNRNRGCWQKSYKWWQVRKTSAACTRPGSTVSGDSWWHDNWKRALQTCNVVGANSNLIIIRTEVVAYGPEDGKGKACKSDLCREETWILIVIWASDGESLWEASYMWSIIEKWTVPGGGFKLHLMLSHVRLLPNKTRLIIQGMPLATGYVQAHFKSLLHDRRKMHQNTILTKFPLSQLKIF